MDREPLQLTFQNGGQAQDTILRRIVLAVLSEMGVTGVSQAEIQNAVSSYLSNHPIEGITENEVTEIVADYISNHPIDTLTETEVNNIISDYMSNHPTEGVSEEQIAQSVSDYIENHPISGGEGGTFINDENSPLDALYIKDLQTDRTKKIVVKNGKVQALEGDEGYSVTNKYISYTEGKRIAFASNTDFSLEGLKIIDSTATIGLSDKIDVENATKIVLSAFSCRSDAFVTYVYYDENDNPIYAGYPTNDGCEIATGSSDRYIQNYELPIKPNAKYLVANFWKDTNVIKWEHPFIEVTKTYGANSQPKEIQSIFFHVNITKSHAESSDISGGITDQNTPYEDACMLWLPTSYTDSAKKTRLVIHCHGSGGTVEATTQYDKSKSREMLVRMGYAVLDVNGGVADGRHFGAPFAIQSYIKAYQYAIDNYNLYDDVFLYGGSMGGLAAFNIAQSGAIPVKAVGAIAPVTDLYRQAWMFPWSTPPGSQRESIAEYFNFDNWQTYTSGTDKTATEADMQYFVDNIDKVSGYYPLGSGCINIEKILTTDTNKDTYAALYEGLKKISKMPIKIWHAENDTTVACRFSKFFIQAIKNTGGIAYFRGFSSGGHTGNLGDIITMTDINGNEFEAYSSTYELLEWYKRWE